MSLGTHYLVDFYGCNKEKLDNFDFIRDSMLTAAKVAKATIVNDVFHRFSPQGVTGVVVIAESHLSIHTWPEYGYASIDLYTCNEKMDAMAAVDHLRELLQASREELQAVRRGFIHANTLHQMPVGVLEQEPVVN